MIKADAIRELKTAWLSASIVEVDGGIGISFPVMAFFVTDLTLERGTAGREIVCEARHQLLKLIDKDFPA